MVSLPMETAPIVQDSRPHNHVTMFSHDVLADCHGTSPQITTAVVELHKTVANVCSLLEHMAVTFTPQVTAPTALPPFSAISMC